MTSSMYRKNTGQSYVKSASSKKGKNKAGYDVNQNAFQFLKSGQPSRLENVSVEGSRFTRSGKGQASNSLRKKLLDFLVKTAQVQRKLQIIKQTICQQQDFTPASLFHRIDLNRKGYLIQKDILKFMQDNSLRCKGSQFHTLYGKMNTDKSQRGVNPFQFQNFILPNQNPKLRYLTMRRPVYIPLPGQQLSDKVEWILSKLFLEIMQQQVRLRQLNAALISSYDFNAEIVFQFISDHQGYVTAESLFEFMVAHDCELSIQQVGCLMKLMDSSGEAMISNRDFKSFLATLKLKKQHQIFDQLSPVPALKNFVLTIIDNQAKQNKTLQSRLQNNKAHGSPSRTSRSKNKYNKSQMSRVTNSSKKNI